MKVRQFDSKIEKSGYSSKSLKWRCTVEWLIRTADDYQYYTSLGFGKTREEALEEAMDNYARQAVNQVLQLKGYEGEMIRGW